MLNASKAKATGKRATAAYRHWLCTPIIKPTNNSPRPCWRLKRHGTRASTTSRATRLAVTKLRVATPVATSMPLLNASRAAMWLDAIIKAISNRVKKACRLKARGEVMGPSINGLAMMAGCPR